MSCPPLGWSTEQVLNLGIMLVLGGGFAGWLGGIGIVAWARRWR